MASFSLSSKLGDDRTATIVATWPDAIPAEGIAKGDPYDLSTALEIWFTAKASVNDPDESAIFVKTLSGGDITVDGATAYVDVEGDDMPAQVAANKTFQPFCEVQVKSAAGKVWTVAEGKWKFTSQLTQGE